MFFLLGRGNGQLGEVGDLLHLDTNAYQPALAVVFSESESLGSMFSLSVEVMIYIVLFWPLEEISILVLSFINLNILAIRDMWPGQVPLQEAGEVCQFLREAKEDMLSHKMIKMSDFGPTRNLNKRQ